jgi:hypothetical protein
LGKNTDPVVVSIVRTLFSRDGGAVKFGADLEQNSQG